MDHWLANYAWAWNSLFIPECHQCVRARACWEWRVFIPITWCVDHTLWWVLRAYQKRKSLRRFLHLLLAIRASPSVMTPGVHGETVFNCTNPKNTIADIDLSVVSECPDFTSTYANASLVNVQIVQRTSSTLVETYACNLIVSREVCRCK